MRVISDPVPVKWSIEKVCDPDDIYNEIGCGATLEVDYTDIYTKEYEKGYWSSSDQEFVNYTAHSFWFKCPCCGKENSIDEEVIPKKIRVMILNSEKEKKQAKRKKKSVLIIQE